MCHIRAEASGASSRLTVTDPDVSPWRLPLWVWSLWFLLMPSPGEGTRRCPGREALGCSAWRQMTGEDLVRSVSSASGAPRSGPDCSEVTGGLLLLLSRASHAPVLGGTAHSRHRTAVGSPVGQWELWALVPSGEEGHRLGDWGGHLETWLGPAEGHPWSG